ncbi:MAG: hypothetical protein AB1782_12080 [Cyanobacteriota bacterium]
MSSNVVVFGKKPPGDIYFSRWEKALDRLNPRVECDILFEKESTIYFYIYSTKNFKTDLLKMLLIKMDNKGVMFPKIEVEQTLDVDVDPNYNAVRGKIVVYKAGQYYVRVFSPNEPKKPVAESELLID